MVSPEQRVLEVLARMEATQDRLETKLNLLLEDAGIEAAGPVCPGCGSENVQDTSAGDLRRITCLACGESAPSEQEALNG